MIFTLKSKNINVVSLPSADHSRILLPSDELDRETTHRDLSVFTKWQKERNISDVVL